MATVAARSRRACPVAAPLAVLALVAGCVSPQPGMTSVLPEATVAPFAALGGADVRGAADPLAEASIDDDNSWDGCRWKRIRREAVRREAVRQEAVRREAVRQKA